MTEVVDPGSVPGRSGCIRMRGEPTSPGQEAPMATTFRQADADRIRSVTTRLVEEHHLPGVSVGVVIGDDLVFAEGFGYADIESGRRQDPALRQRIGSITKTMVGMCTMALVDEGRLSLDDRVVELLPDITFHGPAETLAVRHLVTHTGGIGEAPTMASITDPYEALWSDTPDVPPISESLPRRHPHRGDSRDEVVLRQPRLRAARRDHRPDRGQPDREGAGAASLRATGHGRLGLLRPSPS